MNSLTKRIFKQIAAISVCAGSLVSFISDFLVPIAPFALWIGLLVFSFFGIITLYRLLYAGAKPREGYEGIWYAPIAISSFLFSVICLSTYYISIQYVDENGVETGYLASNSKLIETIQKNSLLLKSIEINQVAGLEKQDLTNTTLKKTKDITEKTLLEQIELNKSLSKANDSLTQSLNESRASNQILLDTLENQKEVNKTISKSNEILLATLKEEKKTNETLMSSLETQKAISNNAVSQLKASNNIEDSTYFSLESLRDALVIGDIEKIKEFHKKRKNLKLVKNSVNQFSDPMIIEMLKQNKRNPEVILDYLLSLEGFDLSEEYKVQVYSNTDILAFWQMFIKRTDEIDEYILNEKSFSSMQNDFKKEYGYIIPDKLEESYKSTVPIASEKYRTNPGKYTYSGIWLHGNPTSLVFSLYSLALFYDNSKAIEFLSDNGTKNLGYFSMPSGVKILLDPSYL